MSSSLPQSYQQLKRAFDARPADLATCVKLLAKLKLAIIENGLYPPGPDATLNDLTVARDILEIGAFCSIRGRDVPAFDRYFAQVQTFYTDYNTVLPPSPREYPLRGLNLIRLLTQNRIADFHTSLESLPVDVLHDNPYIKHPVDLERWLMEGSYSKVWSGREKAPAEEYRFFVDSLMGTIRNEIASCEEAAYDSIPLKDAATLLFFNNRSDLITYAQQRGWQISLVDEKIIFARKGEEKTDIPKAKLIINNLSYARELEQIV